MKLWKILAIICISLMPTIGLAISSEYYAKVPVYFNVPSDASFAVALPSSYTFTDITGTSEAGATTLSWISFNFTDIPQYWVEPIVQGVSTDAQNGAAKPIFLIDATGNVNITVSIRFESSLPSGITVCANATCSPVTGTSCGTVQETCTSVDTSYVQLASNLAYSGNTYLNVTLYANVTSGVEGGEYGAYNLYIKGAAV